MNSSNLGAVVHPHPPNLPPGRSLLFQPVATFGTRPPKTANSFAT